MTAKHYFSITQICQVTQLTEERVVEIVQLGIVEPPGHAPEEWQFDAEMLCLLRRAQRLHLQLEINWPGVALALELLTELERSRAESHHLRQRLRRLAEED